jgi:general nucleoside transport system ATP-binding protein
VTAPTPGGPADSLSPVQAPTAAASLVAVRNIVKRFGDFTANDHVSLELMAGEVHALLGENGAGKSTLVKILYGLLMPSEGDIIFDGEPVRLSSPEEARARGIGMVFQHFSLFENLTVSENIALVLPPHERLDRLPQRIADVAQRYGIVLEPNRPVWTLSAGYRNYPLLIARSPPPDTRRTNVRPDAAGG